MNIKKIFILIFVLITMSTNAQEKEKKWTLNGYVKDMQTAWVDTASNLITDNLIHNRLNFKWYPNDKFNFTLEARNRLMWGTITNLIPNYDSILNIDRGFLDLSETVLSSDAALLHTMVDRLYFDYTNGNLNVRLGRQRINWGIDLVWNPNDVFNSFSYFDFDYEERPGTDALKVQYYTGMTSSMEFVYKIDDDIDKMAFAGMYKFNKWGYDFQFLSGLVQKDIVAGTGFSGHIKGAGLNGEATYFHPKENISDTNGILVAGISANYSLKNGLMFNAGMLYNSNGTTGNAGGTNILMNSELSAKRLTNARISTVASLSYPITPLFGGSFAIMYNPNDKSAFVGPTFTYSLANNVEFMTSAQIFTGKDATEFGDYGEIFFIRFRYSF
ncbi:MAG: hypothetical protein K9J13_08390 [Saprospiraceae bacterium]|nr:hypothetical protein [Saprospiraceae bacterium]